MRRRHGGAAEEGPAGTVARAGVGFAYACDRAEDIDADRGKVRFDGQVDVRWTLAAEAGKNVLVGSNELLERSFRRRCRRSGGAQRGSFVLADHDRGEIIIKTGRAGHRDGVTSNIVDYEHGDSTGSFGVRDLLAKRAVPAIDDCEIARCSGRDASASVGSGIEQVERIAWQSVEVTHRGTYSRAATRGVRERLADEVLVCARANRDHIASASGRFNGAAAWAAVARSHCNANTGFDCVVETNRQKIVVTMISAAERQVEDVHSIGNCGIDRVEDVLGTGVQHVTWEDIVVTQKRPRRYPGHVVDIDAVRHCRLPGDS